MTQLQMYALVRLTVMRARVDHGLDEAAVLRAVCVRITEDRVLEEAVARLAIHAVDELRPRRE